MNQKRDRGILHCDMNNFYASVELLDYPELKKKPVAISGSQDHRHGIILAKNQIAKSYGIVTAETIWQAKKKCHDLVLLPPRREKYSYYSKLINKIYLDYTDMVEPFSIDESWLDVTGSENLLGSPFEIAEKIRHRVKKELGLTLSAGVSFNKIFAKMGSEYKKPDATTLISRENFKDLLWPMAVGNMFFVGKVTGEKLTNHQIYTIGDLACANPIDLKKLLGKHGLQLYEYANGLDNTPVSQFHKREPIKSVGNGITFSHNLTTYDEVYSAITHLSDTVASRLRQRKLKASGVKVDIKDPQFNTLSRQIQLANPTNLAQTLREASMKIIKESWNLGKTCKPIRLLTVTGINLCHETEEFQLSLFNSYEGEDSNEDMERTMDKIREKFGSSAINFGTKKDL